MELRRATVETLKELISINSVSGKEKDIQEYIESRLMRAGINLEKQPVEGDRFNLIYNNRSEHLISCHVDTVPPAGMEEPFLAREEGDRIYGRGASDVKGALSALIVAIESFVKENLSTELPLSLAFVVDEETNSALGSEKAVEVLGEGKKCLVLEPTYGKFCTSQLGSLEFSLTVKGQSVHGAEFELVENPIKVCMELIKSIEEKLNRDVSILKIKGGSGLYMVPDRCETLLEVKLYEGESWKEIEEKIKEALKEGAVSCELDYRLEDVEEFIEFKKGGFLKLLEDTFEEALGRKPERGVMPSWTDASNYHRAGYECVVFGEGSLAISHTDRESISISELESMALFFKRLLEKLR